MSATKLIDAWIIILLKNRHSPRAVIEILFGTHDDLPRVDNIHRILVNTFNTNVQQEKKKKIVRIQSNWIMCSPFVHFIIRFISINRLIPS